MRRKKTFVTPLVTKRIPLKLEDPILGPSIEFNTKVISMGQDVVIHDFSTDNEGSYTAEWE